MNHTLFPPSQTSYANVIKFDSIEFALILQHVFFNCSGYDFDVSLLATMTNCCFDTRYLRSGMLTSANKKVSKKQNTFYLTRTWLKFEIFPIFLHHHEWRQQALEVEICCLLKSAMFRIFHFFISFWVFIRLMRARHMTSEISENKTRIAWFWVKFTQNQSLRLSTLRRRPMFVT